LPSIGLGLGVETGQRRENKFMTSTDLWTYRAGEATVADVGRSVDVSGFSVEALDGGIGKVDEATYDVGSSFIVVDTGPWIFGRKSLLPAGVIDRIDLEDESVYVRLTKDQIKNAPEMDETTYRDESYRSNLDDYYAGL
jgi:hypothetical protein